MVQCRQIYVLCHASLRGLFDGRELIEQAWTQTQRCFYRAELSHRWAFSVNPNGGVADDRCDTYTLAFVLYTLAWLYRVDPQADVIEKADELLRFFDDRLAAPNGGFTDGIPRHDELLRQNTNMHLLEACLALFDATGRPDFLDRAHALRRVFADRMLARQAQALPEWHGEGWRQDFGNGNWYEPGIILSGSGCCGGTRHSRAIRWPMTSNYCLPGPCRKVWTRTASPSSESKSRAAGDSAAGAYGAPANI